jgi:hypothetical protein
MGRVVAPCRGHDLGSRLTIRVGHQTLEVAVIFLVLGTSPVFDDMAFALLALHDPEDVAPRTVLLVVVEATSKFPLLALAVMLVDVTAGVAVTPVLVKVDGWRDIRSGLVDLLLDRGEPAMRRPIGSAA